MARIEEDISIVTRQSGTHLFVVGHKRTLFNFLKIIFMATKKTYIFLFFLPEKPSEKLAKWNHYSLPQIAFTFKIFRVVFDEVFQPVRDKTLDRTLGFKHTDDCSSRKIRTCICLSGSRLCSSICQSQCAL